MSKLREQYNRRIEKIIQEDRPTIPPIGTNHVDNEWLDTDIYQSELSINLSNGSLFTSDGMSIIELNKLDQIIEGLILSKKSYLENTITVSDGTILINGKKYAHKSIENDIILETFQSQYYKIIFIYASASNIIADGYPENSGINKIEFKTKEVLGTLSEPNGIYSYVINNNIENPENSILIGCVLMPPNDSPNYLYPISISDVNSIYPKFSISPSEFFKSFYFKVMHYKYSSLYLPNTFIIDDATNTIYLSKKTFYSNQVSILNDIELENIVPLHTGEDLEHEVKNGTNIGNGTGVFKEKVDQILQFRSLISDDLNILLNDNETEIILNANTNNILKGLTNIGNGIGIYTDRNDGIASLLSLTGGTNINIELVDNTIKIYAENIGHEYNCTNIGNGLQIYKGILDTTFQFKTLNLTNGLTGISTYNTIEISGENFIADGENIGSGPHYIYKGKQNGKMEFAGLSAGNNINIQESENTIVISLTGDMGTIIGGTNIGSTGYGVFNNVSNGNMQFNNISGTDTIELTLLDNTIYISSTVQSGMQGERGFQGFQGPSGINGINGINGNQGFQGPMGYQGIAGPQGYGLTGFQGPMGPSGSTKIIKVIDVYDKYGSQSIEYGYPKNIIFGDVSNNTSSGTFLHNISTGSITILESGFYNFEYIISVNFGNYEYPYILKSYLYNKKNDEKISNSIVYMSAIPKNKTNGTSVGILKMMCEKGDEFQVYCELEQGSIVKTLPNSSSFKITKLEEGYGPQGPIGPTGEGSYNDPDYSDPEHYLNDGTLIYHIDDNKIVSCVDEYMLPLEMDDYNYFNGNENYPVLGVKNNCLKNIVFWGNFKMNNLLKINHYEFEHSTFNGTLELENCTYIGHNAFKNSSFTNLIIPNAIFIGDEIFTNSQFTGEFNCPNLSSVGYSAFRNSQFTGEFNCPNVSYVGTSAFQNSQFTGTFNCPNVSSVGTSAFENSQFTGTFNCPNVSYVGYSAFENSLFTGEFNCPNLTQIYDYAFTSSQFTGDFNCPNLSSVGYSAFENSQFTGEFNCPNVSYVGASAFQNSNFTTITIGSNVSLATDCIGAHSAEFISDYNANGQMGGTYIWNSETNHWVYQV